MLLVIPILTISVGGVLLWMTASPSRLAYLLPVLLAFEYRMRASMLSFDLAELCLVVALGLWLVNSWGQTAAVAPQESTRYLTLIFLLAFCAFPSIFFEFDTAHAASVYRDLMLPFVFFLLFLRARLEKQQVHTLIKLGCVLAVFNACLGIVQYATGNYLWFAGPDEADWQAYKTGLARLSIFGTFLRVGDTLPVGLYTGANNFACFLSLPLCLVSTLAFSRELARRQRRICGVAALILFVSLVLTIFRSGLLVYAASMMLVYFILHPRNKAKRAIVLLLIASLIAILFLTQGLFDWDQFGSFQGRQDMIAASLEMIKSHPELLLTGGYADLYHMQSKETQEIHNLFLYCVVHYGLPATLLFFAFFIRFFRRSMVAARSARPLERNILVAIFVSVTANVFFYGATTMLVDSVQTSIWLLFWVGIGAYLIEFQNCEFKIQARGNVPRPAILRVHGDLA
jgi:O-antigen ligase